MKTFYDDLTEFIFVEDTPQRADYIFIPGSGYGELAQKAAQLYRQGYAKKIVVSGKYSILKGCFEAPVSPAQYTGRSYETECDFLTEVLRDNGVCEEDILQEKQASYTYENAIYTAKLLKGERVERALLVCQAFHARRSLMYYQLLFPDTRFFVCPVKTQGITRENWYMEEKKIDTVLQEAERCGGQFHEIMKERLKKGNVR